MTGSPQSPLNPPTEWKYCPECGSLEARNHPDLEKSHRQCLKCRQEWFTDVDYSATVRSYLHERSEHEETVSTLLEALKGAETFLEMYLEDCKESDARIAERDGYSDGYTSLHTQNVEQDLDAVRAAIAKAGG